MTIKGRGKLINSKKCLHYRTMVVSVYTHTHTPLSLVLYPVINLKTVDKCHSSMLIYRVAFTVRINDFRNQVRGTEKIVSWISACAVLRCLTRRKCP
jgi:hypothetical protein